MGTPVPPGRRPPRILTGRERAEVLGLYAAILGATVLGFVLLFLIARDFDTVATATRPAVEFASLGLVAYVLGVRHGVDADHIAAIDNTTRKLLQEGKRPLTVGTWFSLGHSTVVVALIVGLVIATNAVQSHLAILRSIGSTLGALVAGTFLCVLGLVNVVITWEVYRIFQGLKRGEYDAKRLEEQLSHRGLMNRYFGRLFRVVSTPRQIYPIGVLFGFGFDTASEIALIIISITATVSGQIPIYVVLVLPLLFTCGMVLVDTSDAIAMRYAYGWAFERPIRKIYYNLTVTVISVLVAFAIGGAELLQVLASSVGLSGGFWSAVGNLDLETVGFVIVGIFLAVWGFSVLYYRYRRYDEIGFPAGGPGRPVTEG